MKHGADPYYHSNELSLFDTLVGQYQKGSFEIIDYILTHRPIDLNTYILQYSVERTASHTIMYYTLGRPNLVLIFLKHGLDCNSLIYRKGLVSNFYPYSHIITKLLEYPIRLDILERDLEYITERADSATLRRTQNLVYEEIQRRKEP
jgi:hypothetical protein